MDATGIICDSHRESGRGRFIPSGIAVFDSVESRRACIEELQAQGFRYFTEYQDTQGPGLSWALDYGLPKNPRLPSVQRQLRFAAHHINLYRNPGYDLIHDPDPRYTSRW